MTHNSCQFVFDPSEWEASNDTQCAIDEELLEDGCWNCHRDTHSGSDYCLFHLPIDEKDPDRVSQKFLKTVRNSGETGDPKEVIESLQFIGARFDELSLSYAVIGQGSNYPIDLRYATVKECLDIEYANISTQFLLNGCQIGDINAHGCTFENRTHFKLADVDILNLQSAVFEDRFDISRASIGLGKLFNSVFKERAIFKGTTFRRPLLAKGANFRSETVFSECRFLHRSTFISSVFNDSVKFSEVKLDSTVSFEGVKVENELIFDPSKVADDVTQINLKNSSISDGCITYPSTTNLNYDFTQAQIGSISIKSSNSTVDLQRFKFIETSFKNFDFSKYTDSLVSRQWLIHPVSDDDDLPKSGHIYKIPLIGKFFRGVYLAWKEYTTNNDFDPGILRSTYLKAKNGAKEVGDDSAAAEFFLHEMRYKRKSYRKAMIGKTSVAPYFKWAFNWGYNITAGYGERPARTFSFSIMVIFIFALIYHLLASLSTVAAFALSFQSFVSLVLGEPTGASQFPLLAAFEAFIGAFLIALFVFTLTRSINR